MFVLPLLTLRLPFPSSPSFNLLSSLHLLSFTSGYSFPFPFFFSLPFHFPVHGLPSAPSPSLPCLPHPRQVATHPRVGPRLLHFGQARCPSFIRCNTHTILCFRSNTRASLYKRVTRVCDTRYILSEPARARFHIVCIRP